MRFEIETKSDKMTLSASSASEADRLRRMPEVLAFQRVEVKDDRGRVRAVRYEGGPVMAEIIKEEQSTKAARAPKRK